MRGNWLIRHFPRHLEGVIYWIFGLMFVIFGMAALLLPHPTDDQSV
ncbi:MAG: hypothetical protein ACRENP_11910 [Longimicrobiales bacterium]